MSAQLQVTGEAKIRDIQGPVVANSGVITALDGAASQYVRGDGTLADFPSSTGGGSSVSYYLNGSVNQGTFGGSTYYEMSKTPVIGTGTDFAVSTNGLVSQFITDANDPDLLEVPGGNFNVELYFSVSNNTGNPNVYAELYKYDGSTFTLLGSSSAVPEYINQGTTIAPYYFAIPVGTAALNSTDRIAIRIYANVDGRTVTLHTENSHLCQVVTTFSKGMISLNNLTKQNQYFATGTSGTDFNIVSSGDTHTFNIPNASSSNRGLITTGTQTIAGNKTFSGLTNFNNSIGVEYFAYFDGDGTTGNGGILIKQYSGAILAGVDYTTLFATPNQLGLNFGGAYNSFLQATSLTANRTYTLPDASGTIALTSDFSTYVPYTGATGDVNLGLYNISAQNAFLNGISGVNGGNLFLKQDIDFGQSAGYTTLYSTGKNLGFVSYVGSFTYNALFSLNSLTNNSTRTFTLPDASGTLALTSNLSSYVPYTGATANVDLGSFGITGNDFNAQGLKTEYSTLFKHQSNYIITQAGYTAIGGSANGLYFNVNANGRIQEFSFDSTGDRVYTFPALSGTLALLEGAQTFSGAKTFSATTLLNTIYVDGVSYLKHQTTTSYIAGYTTFNAKANGVIEYFFPSSFKSILDFNDAADYTYTFPASSGTLALTSNLAGYLPLTGGTLTGPLYGTFGVFSNFVSAFSISADGSGSTNAGVIQFKPNPSVAWTTGYVAIAAQDLNTLGFYFSGSFSAYFNNSALTNGRTYTLPNANGTLALTSNLSSYLPLTGGTLTGALSGTSATFSGAISSTTTGLLYLIGAKIGGDSGGTIDFNYNTGGTPSFTWWGGTTSSKFSVTSTGAATFSNSVLINGTSGGNAISSLNVKTDGTKILAIEAIAPSGNKSIYIKPVDSGIHLISSNYLSSGPYLSLALSARENTSDFVLTNGGNVGIGTSSPSQLLEVYKSQNASTNLLVRNDNSGASAETYLNVSNGTYLTAIGTRGTGTAAYNSLDTSSGMLNYNGNTSLTINATDANAVIKFTTNNFTERMRITSGGNVGIGTSSPVVSNITGTSLSLLQVTNSGGNGQVRVGGSSAGVGLTLDYNNSSFTTSTIRSQYGSSSNDAAMYLDSGFIAFRTGTSFTERMRITSGGFLKASNNGTYYSVTSGYHELISNNVGNTTAVISNTSSDPYGLFINLTVDPNNASNYIIKGYSTNSGISLYTIFSNGTTSGRSDIRLKKNITNATSKLDSLMKLRVVNYEWKESLNGTKEIGLIAQEVEEVFPNLVITEPVIKTREITKEDGSIIEEKYEDGDSKSIKHSVLPFMLLKALQEANVKIEELSAKVTALENQLNK